MSATKTSEEIELGLWAQSALGRCQDVETVRAMRVMLNAVLVDLWRTSRGMPPRFGQRQEATP